MVEPGDLLARLGGFSERAYLEFLASRVPADLPEQLEYTELAVMPDLDTEDVLRPLKNFSFSSKKEEQFRSLLLEESSSLVCGGTKKYERYAAIYLCSLYLHRCPRWNGSDWTSAMSGALVERCLDTDAETRTHVLKFLLWLDGRVEPRGAHWRENRPFYLLAVCMLLCTLLGDLVDATNEYADQAPKKELSEEQGILAYEPYDFTWRKLMEKLFGSEGEILEIASRCQRLFGRRGYKRGKTEGG